MTLYSAPSLSGTMYVSSTYQTMGAGLTDRVFIIGHADGLDLNDPYQVLDVGEACKELNLNSTSPLLRTMLEVYYGGGRDIWLVAAAPMAEYQPTVSLRTNSYYSTYATRLIATYQVLRDWELAQVLVLAEAPFYDAKGVDFVTPLINHCVDAFNNTGAIRIGLIGTRTGNPLTQQDIMNMVNDSRLQSLPDGGKYISVMVGEGSYSFTEMPSSYVASVIGGSAAIMSTLDLRLSMINTPIPNMVQPIGLLTDSQISSLAEKQLNSVSQTTKGLRGTPYQSVMMTDNTLAPIGSDFWSLTQVRLVLAIMSQLTIIGNRFMGTIGYGQFKTDCTKFMDSLKNNNYFKSYSLDIARSTVSDTSVLVAISVTPYLGLRQISFTTTIGPGI